MTETSFTTTPQKSIRKVPGHHMPATIGRLRFDAPTPSQFAAQLAEAGNPAERERLAVATYTRLFDEASGRLSRP